ncbi:MAG TPA: PEP-CTERM sorting domain-containing protein [Verrucomicrobiae bacterium]
MKRIVLPLALAVAVCAFARVTRAQILFSENFNVNNTASWTVNDPALSDIGVDFFYDYSLIGVPAAPNGSGTLGLKMTANNSGGVFSGFSVSPTGQSFSGNYQVSFDLWQNYVGPLGVGGSGSTQLSTFGIGTSGTTAFWPGAAIKESVTFAVSLDGGSASDYRAYSSAAPTSYASGNAVYLAPGGAINNSAAYYAVFTPQSAPAAQVALFPGQTGTTDPGEASFLWRRVVIDVVDGFAEWSIDGLPIAKVDLSTVTLGGGNILFGHTDSNATSSTDPNDSLLNVTLIDNIVVNAVPEPSSLALLIVGGLALALRRRRS